MNELKNYKVETNGKYGDPEFYIVTANNVKEAHDIVKDEIDRKNHEYNIIGVTLIDKEFKGIKAISYSCC